MGLIVSRQKAYNLTVTRRKRVIFYPQKVQGTSNLSISADLPRTTVPRKISKLENQFPCSQKHTLQTLQDLTTCLYLKMCWNFIVLRKAKTRYFKTLIYTLVNIYLNFWIKFPLVITFNSQKLLN